jgi:hypothetical protein
MKNGPFRLGGVVDRKRQPQAVEHRDADAGIDPPQRQQRPHAAVAGEAGEAVDGHLSRIGWVRVVVSKRPRGPWTKCIAIVTNETGLRARQIVEIYERRWLIEVLFKELAQDVGLDDYQMLRTDGIVRHLHVCCLAHLLLTHQSIEGLGAQARKANKQVEMPPMSQRLAEPRA